MEKRISPLRLGFTFAGCFLGAGYVSGRELWQFFGRFGGWGWAGLTLAMLCLGLLGAVTLLLARRTNTEALDRLVIPWDAPAARQAVVGFSLLFLFGVDSIMTAGVGAIFEQGFGLRHVWTSLLFSLVVAVFTLTGLEGMVGAFSVSVPVLTAAAIGMSLLALFRLPAQPNGGGAGEGWLFSALTFSSYNMFGSVAILAPLGRRVTGRGVVAGVGIGTGLLMMMAALFLLVLDRDPAAPAEQLPMLYVAEKLSPALALLFSLLLFLAMFGTAFSSFLTGLNQLAQCAAPVRRHRTAFVFLASGLIWGLSLFGFGDLIDTVYPAFGVASVGFLLCMLYHFAKIRTAPSQNGGGDSPG